MKQVKVFAPISIGNVSVGFDSLGLALSPIDGHLVGDLITINEHSENELIVSGTYADRLPPEPDKNIVWDCLAAFNEALAGIGREPDTVQLVLEKNIPVSSGLGSSACSVVAAFDCLNQYYGKPFNEADLLQMMAVQEGKISGSIHYDNIAPCYLGGLQLMTPDPAQPALTIPSSDEHYWVMAYPDIIVSTKAAREVLPDQYDRATAITFAQQLASFVSACHNGRYTQAFSYVKDVIAEPYRASMLPGYVEVREKLLANGSLAVGISGSGPTIFSVHKTLEQAQHAKELIDTDYVTKDTGFTVICKVDHRGSRTISDDD